MSSNDKGKQSATVDSEHAREQNLHAGKQPSKGNKNTALAEISVMNDDAIALIRDGLISARENAIKLREDSATSREDSATSREDSATLREELSTLREQSATLREIDIFADNTSQEVSLEYVKKLQQVNERLIIATIGAQKLADDLLIAKKQLENAKNIAERANLAKTEFLSNMSHELRTPLNAILGFSQLLESGKPAPTSSQIVRVHEITKAGWYLLDLINQVLDLAVIESGKLSLSRDPVSLTEVISECQAMIEAQALSHNVDVTFHPFDETCIANADKTRVKQVLLNLLSNAIKYNRAHGTVEISCKLVQPHRIHISIKDSGHGLSPDRIAQLFQPFNRLGQEKNGAQGTGIGLVVTKQLVELMGGTIGVESTPESGSTFWIELNQNVAPASAVKNTPSVLPENQQDSTNLRTLLYMEDNPANLMLVEQIIREYPHLRIFSAVDDGLSIALAYADLLDVILIDVNMPGMDGYKTLDILRKNPGTANIPVIALSANITQNEIKQGLEAGFFRYITKPIKINEFKLALLDALIFSAKSRLNDNKTGSKS